jgi:succinate dehydrogenase hydrophobic anchor subunit
VKFVKRVLLVLVVGFCLFYLVQQPEGAAASVRTVFGALARAFNSILTFFTSLAG